MQTFDFDQRMGKKAQQEFAEYLIQLQSQIDFKISARGWCYQLESERVANKDQFDKIEAAINKCRAKGYLPVDFVAEETARMFSGVERPSTESMGSLVKRNLEDVIDGHRFFTPDWWEDEEYYIQVLVEKVDLLTLFKPVCEDYHIPIENSKGWSSVLQRASYARRFQRAERRGMKCVLLYCGDHDPDGMRISEFLRKNLDDLKNVRWSWGQPRYGYDPSNLIIERFGLNTDFIDEMGLTWIDNLMTGRKRNLASPSHPNFSQPYVQKYLEEIGERKCEANAIIPYPDAARNLIRNTIEKFVGEDAEERFEAARQRVEDRYRAELGDDLIENIEQSLGMI